MRRRHVPILAALAVLCAAGRALTAPPQTVTIAAAGAFDEVVTRVERAVEAHSLVHIATASASRAAAGRGVKIPGNAVVLAFNNLYAVRLLAASVPAGIEAPMRFYVTEDADGATAITYERPSAVLAPYGGRGLGALGRELDAVFAAIAEDAARN